MKQSTQVVKGPDPTEAATELRSAALFSLAVFALLVLYWAIRIRLAYSPAGDEFSLLAHSALPFHPQPLEWFRQGFSGYFSPYPDLSLPYSNFLRPVANATYFLQSLVFGRHWSMYLLGSYAIEAALVATGWFLARVCLRLRPSLALLATASCAFSPAFNYLVVFRPSFAFDLLGGLFALLVLSTLLRSRWLAAWLLVWCAVFTKESAYYAAPAACIAVFLLRSKLPASRRLLSASLYLLPLACILVLRRLDFAGVQGVYVLNQASGTGPVGRALLGLTHWPYVLPGPGRVHVFAMGMTGIVWCLLLLVAFEAVQRREGGGELPRSRPEDVAGGSTTLQVFLVFLFGSLLLPVGLDLANRFGASAFPLLFLVLGSLADGRYAPRAVRWLSAGVLLLATAADAEVLASSLFRVALHQEQQLWARSRDVLSTLAVERRPVVFLVADGTESFTSPENLERVSGYHGTIVPVSNLVLASCPGGVLSVQELTPITYVVHSVLPASCGSNSLGATFYRTPAPLHTFVRDLPQATLAYDAHGGGWRDGEFSTQVLDIVLRVKVADFALLVPEAQGSAGVREITPESAR